MEQSHKTSIVTLLAILAVIVIAALFVWWAAGGFNTTSSQSQAAAAAAANLNSASNFAVLAGSAIVDSNLSTIVGDVGLSPASGSFNALSCPEVTGTIYSDDGLNAAACAMLNPVLLTSAMTDLTAAYTTAAGETPVTTLPGADNQLGSQTLTPGIYTFSAASMANLSGPGTPDGQ